MTTEQTASESDKSPADTVNELKELLVAYARQETVGQFGRLGKWVGFGLAGAVALAVGLIFLALALLRALQTETGTFDGSWNWVPYVIVLVAVVVVMGLLAAAMTRNDKESETP